MRSKFIDVTIDLNGVRSAAAEIKQRTGKAVIAVIKADAYGLGAPQIAHALTGVVDDFAYFSLEEAVQVGKPGLILGPPDGTPAEYRDLCLRPSVSTLDDAIRYRNIPVAINVDTGMQRFGCPAEIFTELLQITHSEEVFSHGTDPAIADKLKQIVNGCVDYLHVACTGMLDYPEAWLSAVRPGLAIYRGNVRVAAKLTHIRDLHGDAGYTKLSAARVGLFPAGYCEGVQPGPVIINGKRQRIIEVNMNASYVTIDRTDRVGDEVVMLGDGITEAELAKHFNVRDHEILCRFAALGMRQYVGETRVRTDGVKSAKESQVAMPTNSKTPEPKIPM